MKKINLINNITTILIVFLMIQNSFAESLYDLKTNWRDTENNKIDISIAKGYYTIITMIYTGCPHACPMTISKIKEIEKDFSKIKFTDLKMVLASFDVKNDRPQKLKEYQAKRKLDPSQWKFLVAETEDDARKLAVTLGISYKKIGDGDYSHSNLIALLDPYGKIVGSISSLNANTQPLVDGLQKSLKKEGKK